MILSFDIGGTKIASALIDGQRIVLRRQTAMPKDIEGFGRAVDELVADMPAPERVAVASTGFIREGRIHAVNPNIISFWNGFALQAFLAARFACPIAMLNDAQAAAWAEYRACESAVGTLLYLTLSTGVGGGLVVGRQLQMGVSGLAGHVGHSTLGACPVDGHMQCGCGRTGCLEMVASGTAIARQGSFMFSEQMDSREVFARAATDSRAEQILMNAANAVAEAISNCVMSIGVEYAVIGGSVGLAPGMIERIRTCLQAGPELAQVPVASAVLGADSGLIGAAHWMAEAHAAAIPASPRSMTH